MSSISNIEWYLDGGTVKIEMDNGRDYYIDGRMGTETRMGLYLDKYPGEGGKIVASPSKEVDLIVHALKNYAIKNPTHILCAETYSNFYAVHSIRPRE